MDTQQALLEVKQRILSTLTPLVLEGEGDPAEKASLMLAMMSSDSVTPEFYNKTLDVVNQISDVSVRTDLLMQLLGNVQLALGDASIPEVPPATAESAQEQPEA